MRFSDEDSLIKIPFVLSVAPRQRREVEGRQLEGRHTVLFNNHTSQGSRTEWRS